MMIVKADARSGAGTLPSEAELAAMAKYDEELVNAGAMAAARSSGQGVTVAQAFA